MRAVYSSAGTGGDIKILSTVVSTQANVRVKSALNCRPSVFMSSDTVSVIAGHVRNTLNTISMFKK